MEIKLRDFLICSLLISMVMSENSSLCNSKFTCSECIQTSSCAWCIDPNYNGSERCFFPSTEFLSLNYCPEEFIFNPENQIRTLQNAEFSRENNIQVKPQKIEISMRLEETVSVFMDYKEVMEYPIDIYYLMDLGQSTEDDQQNLFHLGDQLSLAIQNISNNFRFGFGSFSTSKSKNASNERLEPTCGFHHHMSLSNDGSRFSDIVRKSKASNNMYKFNGGLDAILQAIECRNQIGWRTNARKILVVSTANYFINEENKKLTENVGLTQITCNLSSNESCSKVFSPTIEQINSSVKKNLVNVIFVVTMPVLDNYKQLVKNIEGSTVGTLSSDSSNVIELIRYHYMTISSSIEMKHNASDNVAIKFYTRCTYLTEELINTNKCNNIKTGDVINYKIDIELLKCPKNVNDFYQTIEIYPIGINDRLIIGLEMQCRCPCEVSGHKYYQEHSPYCGHNGNYKCGVCECLPNFFGRNCECSVNLIQPSCFRSSDISYNECSGRGSCVCGECTCVARENPAENIYGRYCECDNFSCDRHNGKLCGEHGVCECGSCICEAGWAGSSCECPTSKHSCLPPGDTQEEICSGHGICTCGVCVCQENNEGRYSGRFCEKHNTLEIETERPIDETTVFTLQKTRKMMKFSNTNVEETTNTSMTSGTRKL